MTAENGPNDSGAPFDVHDYLKKRMKLLRRNMLWPMQSAAFRAGVAPGAGGKITEVTGTLAGPAGQSFEFSLTEGGPGRLRLSIPGGFSGTPLSILIAKEFHFFTCGPAIGELVVPEEPDVEMPPGSVNQGDHVTPALHGEAYRHDAEKKTNRSLSAASGGNKEILAEAIVERGRLRWEYRRNGNFLLEAEPKPELNATSVLITMKGDDPTEIERRAVPLRDRGSDKKLWRKINDLYPEALGSKVTISAEPINPHDPEHVAELLAEASFTALPLTEVEAGVYAVDFLFPDQHAAAAMANAGWVLQISESEVA